MYIHTLGLFVVVVDLAVVVEETGVEIVSEARRDLRQKTHQWVVGERG